MIQSTPKKSRVRKILLRILAGILLLPVVAVAGYIAYVYMNYHRLPDSYEQHSHNILVKATLGTEYTAMTWNVGFGAYSSDFSFFMDGGEESIARSGDAVKENLGHVADVLSKENPDFILFQEVDTSATRSWHINEADLLRERFSSYQSYFARNYNSPYLLYPIKQPHGRTQSGLLSLSKLDLFRGERYSLPVETNYLKVLDLDRCYTVIRIPAEDGHQLCLFDVHMSAYTSDGSVATEQLVKLCEAMQMEYQRGNYVVAGGDFNKDLLGYSNRIFGVEPPKGLTWNQPIDRSLIPEGLRLVESLDKRDPIPTCRNCDTGYEPGSTYVLTADGYIVSDNVEVVDCHVIDDGFTASDHNPVKITFKLIQITEAKRYELGPYTAIPGV